MVIITTVTVPTRVIAFLVAGHVHHLWQAWQDPEARGCCTECCGPCWALKELLDRDELDDYYAAYVAETGGPDDIWDVERHEINRKFLDEVWAVDLGCHSEPA